MADDVKLVQAVRRCVRCGRVINHWRSLENGMGRTCAKKDKEETEAIEAAKVKQAVL